VRGRGGEEVVELLVWRKGRGVDVVDGQAGEDELRIRVIPDPNDYDFAWPVLSVWKVKADFGP